MKFEFKKFFYRLYEKFMEEDIFSSAAQVAFYFSFAMFPLLLFLISLFGLILVNADDLRGELFFYLRQVMPSSAYELVQTTIKEVTENSSGGKLTIGLLVALWSASAGFDSLRVTLNSTYNLKETRSWIKTKAMSLFLTLALTVLITVALGIVFYGWKFVSIVLALMNLTVTSPFVLMFVQWVTVLIVLMVIFELLYNFMPNHHPRKWVWITPGAIVSIVLWLGLSYAFRVYLSYFNNYNKTYGSLGAMIILLLWLFLTALVILFGGMINAVLQEMTDPEVAAAAEEAKQYKLDPAKSSHEAAKSEEAKNEAGENENPAETSETDEAKPAVIKPAAPRPPLSPVAASTIIKPPAAAAQSIGAKTTIGLTAVGIFGFLMGMMFRKKNTDAK